MTAETTVTLHETATPEEDEIRLVPLPEVWPPLPAGQSPSPGQAAGTGRASTGRPECGGPAAPGLVPPAAAGAWAAFPRQFAPLLVECLSGVRPARQLAPWLSRRAALHLNRLIPLFSDGQQPRVLRVLTARPAPGVIEMTVIVVSSQRARALAVRLERADTPRHWTCTDIEAG